MNLIDSGSIQAYAFTRPRSFQNLNLNSVVSKV